jgi:hypothetical protein
MVKRPILILTAVASLIMAAAAHAAIGWTKEQYDDFYKDIHYPYNSYNADTKTAFYHVRNVEIIVLFVEDKAACISYLNLEQFGAFTDAEITILLQTNGTTWDDLQPTPSEFRSPEIQEKWLERSSKSHDLFVRIARNNSTVVMETAAGRAAKAEMMKRDAEKTTKGL